MENTKSTKPRRFTKEKIYNFFDRPETFAAKLVQFFIFVLIFASLALIAIEFFYVETFEKYKTLIYIADYFILAIFTVEYVLRIATAPKKIRFFFKPLNLVDFLAVFPNYLELFLHHFIPTNAIRVLRLVRIFRGVKLFKYGSLFKKVFHYKNTILQSITNVIVLFVAFKGIIWALESYGLWFSNADLGELFAIIGFALGIILSQKIGVSYDKFIQVEESAVNLFGTLQSLTTVLNKIEPGLGTKSCQKWAKEFLALLEDPHADNYKIFDVNNKLFESISKIEGVSVDLANLQGDICRDAAFCLSKKVRLTPKAYDTLLHQSVMLYLALTAIFIPGITGMVSVVVATYVLYGMYNLTQDFDSIIGGEFNLISINISELKYLANNK
ncbi:MAG: ion transporter [Candidatus Staskawiczbacteria bacterium]|nr:ion transporter [Candidatus Staskawiczbacteria bacterium]